MGSCRSGSVGGLLGGGQRAEQRRVGQHLREQFSPAAVARKVDSLAKLLQAREQLSNLITNMDGKSGAEELLAKVLADPALLGTLAAAKKPTDAA